MQHSPSQHMKQALALQIYEISLCSRACQGRGKDCVGALSQKRYCPQALPYKSMINLMDKVILRLFETFFFTQANAMTIRMSHLSWSKASTQTVYLKIMMSPSLIRLCGVRLQCRVLITSVCRHVCLKRLSLYL